MSDTPRATVFLDPDRDPREGGPRLGDEKTTLKEFLRFQRLTLEIKCEGLDAEKVAQLRRRVNKLTEAERIALGGEFEEAAMRSRTELVVLFLAVLEMIRRKYATAEQDELFGEIWMRKA